MARSFVVIKPVVDLRNAPAIDLPHDYSHQEGRETQLLQGENLILLETKGEWLKVGALEQLRYTDHEGWHPYPGWVHQSEVHEAIPTHYSHVICAAGNLSYGTLVTSHAHARPLPSQPNRDQIVREAIQFIGAPYLWGGRALTCGFSIASVDCSGLINLLYRAQGMYIPRNAHDQYLKSKPVDTLHPADLLFLAKTERICHVIMKLDEQTFIEAPEKGKVVRLLKWGIDIGQEEGKIWFSDRPALYKPYIRSFIP